MIRFDVASVLLQWAVGGMAFLWVTTRRREVGLGYGWLMRGTYGIFALLAVVLGNRWHADWFRDGAALAFTLTIGAALAVSIQRKAAGVAGQRERTERRSAEVAAMTGIDRDTVVLDRSADEFPPMADLVATAVGAVALFAAAIDAGGPLWLAVVRLFVGAAFLGAISDAMLLGHWYLVQPGLARDPILELVRWSAVIWPVHVAVMLLPTGMVSLLNGTIDDGWNGLLSWYWVASAVATIILIGVTRAALRERQYSAVMAATGLLYLAILTGFGQDLVARALLSA